MNNTELKSRKRIFEFVLFGQMSTGTILVPIQNAMFITGILYRPTNARPESSFTAPCYCMARYCQSLISLGLPMYQCIVTLAFVLLLLLLLWTLSQHGPYSVTTIDSTPPEVARREVVISPDLVNPSVTRTTCGGVGKIGVFTRDSRNCYSASQPSQFCPSVRPSVCHTGGSDKNGAI